jgi:hypothetical protein
VRVVVMLLGILAAFASVFMFCRRIAQFNIYYSIERGVAEYEFFINVIIEHGNKKIILFFEESNN